MNRIQKKDHRTKFFLSCFDEKMYIQNNGSDELALFFTRVSYLNNYLKNHFCESNCFNVFSGQNSFFVKHMF